MDSEGVSETDDGLSAEGRAPGQHSPSRPARGRAAASLGAPRGLALGPALTRALTVAVARGRF